MARPTSTPGTPRGFRRRPRRSSPSRWADPCRLGFSSEAMDRTLPFSCLDHEVKCAIPLVGAWFDQFPHYRAMAWKNREGGDKSHGNGVHFEKEARTKAIKAFVKNMLTR